MELLYFVVDRDDQLRRATREAVEGLWQGRRPARDLDCDVGADLRLITALCDEDLLPVVIYFVRLELDAGAITDRSKLDAYEAMTTQKRRRYDSPAAQRQFIGWPADWPTQLAVALDVPAGELKKIGLGGPLVMSDLWGIPVEKVLAYFEEAAGE